MKQAIIFLLFSIIIFSCNEKRKNHISDDLSAARERASKDTTSVQLIDSVYNFGTVTEGEKVEFSYRFKNIGAKPLVISETHASCGCTVPQTPDKPILPGEVGFIKVVFNSAGKAKDHIEKTITVQANTKPGFPDLLLTGNVAEEK